jgi:hypothetical protein
MLWLLTVGPVPVNKSALHPPRFYGAFGDVKLVDVETTDNSTGLGGSVSAVVRFRRERENFREDPVWQKTPDTSSCLIQLVRVDVARFLYAGWRLRVSSMSISRPQEVVHMKLACRSTPEAGPTPAITGGGYEMRQFRVSFPGTGLRKATAGPAVPAGRGSMTPRPAGRPVLPLNASGYGFPTDQNTRPNLGNRVLSQVNSPSKPS